MTAASVTRRHVGPRRTHIFVALVVMTCAALCRGAQPEIDEPQRLEFHRVHVPEGRIGEVPLGAERYVPMSVEEFEAAVARSRAAAATAATTDQQDRPQPAATAVRYDATIDSRGRLVGTVACDVSAETAAVARSLPLGSLAVVRSGTSAAEAIVFGRPDGGLAVKTPEAGRYALEFACPPLAADVFRLTLVPSLATTIVLRLPPESRPAISGAAARDAIVTPLAATAGEWRIECGPARDIGIAVVPRECAGPSAAVWSEISIRGVEAELAAAVVPSTAWRPGELVLQKDPTLILTAVTIGTDEEEDDDGEDDAADDDSPRDVPSSRESADGRELRITVPPWLEGRRTPLVIRGVAPATGARWKLPLLRLSEGQWAGGGFVVRVDPAHAVVDIGSRDCDVVPPQVATRWPMPAVTGHAALPDGPRPAVFHVEQQSPAASVDLKLRTGQPTLDVARVTTVEISPNAVLGRAACDLRVADGEAFDFTAQVAAGWIIDSVEADAGMAAGQVQPGGPESLGGVTVDWRVMKTPGGSLLRIGLPIGARPGADVRLRVTGHRPALRPGAVFNTADIDMVRFVGEAAGAAVIDFKMGPDAVVEVDGEPVGWVPVQGRLAALVEEGTLRGRIRAGDHAVNREARVVQRRPPVDASVQVRLDARDDLLTQTFTLRCRADAGGIDSLVVNFSEPIGDSLSWSVAFPAEVSVTARRLEPTAGGPAARQGAVAESWLVAWSPAVSGSVIVRAIRTVPFTAAVPVPLAWVEAATQPQGTVVVAGRGAQRPRLIGRRLRALPVTSAAGDDIEHLYGPPSAAAGSPTPELVPLKPGADARAWAWRETVACWCHESGMTEYEARFALENHGRDSVSLTVPSGWSIDHVLVDGAAVADAAPGPTTGMLRVALPASGRRIELVVRAIATASPGPVGWRIDPVACTIDVPVLERTVRLLLPPRLEIAMATGYREIDAVESDWAERLFGSWGGPPLPAVMPSATAAASAPGAFPDVSPADTGFRTRRFAFISDSTGGHGIVVIRRGLLTSLAIVFAAVAAGVSFFSGRRGPATAFTLCVAAVVAALWAPAPFDQIGRMSWWAAVGGILCGLSPVPRPRGRSLRAALVWVAAVSLAAGSPPAASGQVGGAASAPPERKPADPVRVFITADEGQGMALVPERLFRLLADATPGESATIRVLECRITAAAANAPAKTEPWQMSLDLDADAGGVLVIDQSSSGGRWVPRADEPGPTAIRVMIDGPRLRLTAVTAGRQRVDVGVFPAEARDSLLETATISVPPAAVATLDAPVGTSTRQTACDRAAAGAPFVAAVPLAAAGRDPVFDIAAAERVRLVRAVDPDRRLAAEIRAAESGNTVAWGEDGCRVTASFDIDVGNEILRSFIVRADGRLVVTEAAASGGRTATVERLGPERILVGLTPPATGRVRVDLVGSMPLADPVGVFDLPGLWLDGVASDSRSQRLTTTPELEATLGSTGPAAEPAGQLTQRLAVRRRPQVPRGVQNLVVDFSPDRIGLVLRAQIEAAAVALTRIPLEVPVGCTVDRVTLVEDDPAIVDPAARRPVSVVWSQPAPDRVVAVVQQPRAGRFGLEVEARLPIRPARRGTLPLVRAQLSGAPMIVGWQVGKGSRLVVPGAEGNSVEVADGAAGPSYVLTTIDDAADEPVRNAGQTAGQDAGRDQDRSPDRDEGQNDAAAQPTRPTGGGNRVETADVFVAFDGRGRVHGIARLELVTNESTVRLRLPSGMRLFDLLVDGRDVSPVPRTSGVWEVRLDEVGRPRSLLAVFAGDVGPGLAAGEPLRLTAPQFEGQPARQVWWTLRPPTGFTVRVAEPARRLDAAAIAAGRALARERLDDAFAAALAAAGPMERERLEEFAGLRRRGVSLPVERDWEDAVGWPLSLPAGGATVACEAIAADGGITLRMKRAADPTIRLRAVATALVLVLSGAFWVMVAGRRGRPVVEFPAAPAATDSTASMPQSHG